jgi:lactoylglutathione lyase
MGGTPRFAFVKLSVKDLDGQAHFYSAVLGLRPVHRGAGQVLLSDGEEASLVLARRDPVDPGRTVVGFRVADLDATVDVAQTAGGVVRVHPRQVPGTTMRVAIVADPEGHLLELLEQA